MSSVEQGALRSPFRSRTYGGLSKGQIEFLCSEVDFSKPRRILDPMAGQATFLGQLSHEGHDVYLEDVNPGPLLLAALRDPELLMRASELRTAVLGKLPKRQTPKASSDFCPTWLSARVVRDLGEFSQAIGSVGSSLSGENSFWEAPSVTRLGASLAVLAARQISCFRRSDNVTWLKEGGLEPSQSLYDAIKDALNVWCKYADGRRPILAKQPRIGSLRLTWADSAKGGQYSPRLHDLVITSPPYANRLDYTSLWAPELAVAAQLFGIDAAEIKSLQLGTTVVRNRRPLEADLDHLPLVVRQPLEQIKNDVSNVASDSYYFPFFANYAIQLRLALLRMASRLREGGRLILFIRDTVRKDILLPSASLVELVLCENDCFVLSARRNHTVRSHIGVIRRDALGLYGSAQREWWLVFEKARRCK